MARKQQSITEKVYVNLACNCRNGKPVIKWRDLDSHQIKTLTVPEGEDPVNTVTKIRTDLENKLMDGDYDTYEKRARKFIETYDNLAKEKASGTKITNGTKKGDIHAIACKEANISGPTARLCRQIIRAIDDLKRTGQHDKARYLCAQLNISPKKASALIEQKHKLTKKSSVETSLTKKIAVIARVLDERFNKFGGGEFRDECMAILKQLDAKVAEWRASE